MRIALIDIGSNTIRLVAYDNTTEIYNYADYAGLIAHVSDGVLSEEGIVKLIKALVLMKNKASELACQKVYAFATASLRDINDKDALVELIYAATQIKIEIITGQAEAHYDYIGLKSVNNITDGVAFDLGGGSCQIMVFKNDTVKSFVSLPMGGLKLYSMFVEKTLPSLNEAESIRSYVREQLLNIPDFYNCGTNKLYAMGGSVFALATLAENYFKNSVDLTKDVIDNLCNLTEEQINQVVPKRIKSVIPAAIVIGELLSASKADEVVPTPAGVRDGVLADKLNEYTKR